MMRKLIVLFVASVLLVSCGNVSEISDDLVSERVSKYSEKYINRLIEGDVDYCYYQLIGQIQNDESKQVIEQTYEQLKDKKLLHSSIVNYRWQKTSFEKDVCNYVLTYEYEYEGLWVYYSFTIREKNERFKVVGFNVSPYENSLRELYGFSLQNKQATHYIFLFWVLLIPLFILITVGFIVKTPMKKKWLWVVFALLGFVSFQLNWTNGEVAIQFISFRLFGAGIVKSAIIAPWILTFSIPFGAILFWFKRSDLVRKHEELKKVGIEKE